MNFVERFLAVLLRSARRLGRVLSIPALIVALLAGLALWGALPWWLLLSLVVPGALLLTLTRRGRQALAVARMGVSTLPQRLGASSVILVGIAGVVGVLVALLAMSGGLAQTLRATGSNDTAIVLRAGATGELTSAMTHGDATLVAQAPGIARDARGVPLASPELLMVVNLRKRGSSGDANVQLRGVGPLARAVHTHVRLLQGRWFKPGLRELVVGVGAEREFAGVKLGDSVRLGRQPWKVVGVFRSGDAHDSELWADADTMASTYRWGDFSVVNVRLAKPSDFATLKAALLSNPQLHVMVQTTRAYYAAQSEGVTKVIRIVGIAVGVIMALGAIFGALNTMYAAISARGREIATLRAIGFGGLPVVLAVLLETLLLALLGGVLGGAIAWLLFNGYTVSTLGADFSQVVFQFHVSPVLLVQGLKWALAIGFIGGIFPALRAARVPVSVALREL